MDSYSPPQSKRVSVDSPRTSLPVIAITAVMVLGLAFLLTSCESSLTPTDGISVEPQTPIGTANSHLSDAISNSELNKALAAVRRLTAPFHDIDKATDAGWWLPLTDCLEAPGIGGMGYHYGNPTFLANPIPNVLEPEVLVFEPQKNGKLRLVAVEYVVPYDLLYGEGGVPSVDAEPPVLFGRQFRQNPGAGLWMLHVWIWQHNPNGIFEDWNPTVSCQYAS
jgi:hypothetical protein